MGNRVSLILFLLASADLLHADPLYTIETFFTWSGGVLVDLGTLGGSSSSAYGINSSGQNSRIGYDRGRNAAPIGSGSTIDGAHGINDAGQILAVATHDGQRFAVDLAPTLATPESSSVALVLLGLLATTGLRRRV